jgi:glycosyltransferase involved in cell wall biosynthesis
MIRFTSPDFTSILARMQPASGKDSRLILHLAGASYLKGTHQLLQAWFELGGDCLDCTLFVTRRGPWFDPNPPELCFWDSLQPEKDVTFMGICGLERKGNVFLTRERISDSELQLLLATAGTHLCPSVMEGWGHIINQGRMCGALVLTTDAAPMNELVCHNHSGLLLPVDLMQPQTMAHHNHWQCHKYHQITANLPAPPVQSQALIQCVKDSLSLASVDRQRMGDAARTRFEADAVTFRRELHRVIYHQRPSFSCEWRDASALVSLQCLLENLDTLSMFERLTSVRRPGDFCRSWYVTAQCY